MGYCLHTKYQGFGHATAAVAMAIDYAKCRLGVQKLVSCTALNNLPSVKLLKHFNFTETSQDNACFANDQNGNPINFIAGSYELVL